MGQVCLVKKTKKMCGALILCQAIWYCSSLFMHQGKWEVTQRNETKVVPEKIMNHTHTTLFTCTQVHKQVSSTVQVQWLVNFGVCTIQKNCACAK